MTQLNSGNLVVRMLEQEGVQYIFGLSGEHIAPILQGCLDEGIRVIDTRHEQADVFMADGWARVTGRLGVAVVTLGPGINNAISRLRMAQATGSPVIVFGSRGLLAEFEQGSIQEMDSLGTIKTVAFGWLTRESAKTINKSVSIKKIGGLFIKSPLSIGSKRP